MKAVIIAGGKGKRLGKITKKLPKPLVRIGGKPVLEHQINLLVKNGIKEVWLLIGYKGEMIRSYFGNGKKWNIKIRYSQEDRPLGTAGAVKSISEKLSTNFLVLYGDVMINCDIKRFIRFHRRYGRDSLATIVVHPNDHPLESDLVEIKNSHVINIHPKPHPTDVWQHNLVNAAVYILSPKIFSFIPTNKETDFGRDVFLQLLKKKKKIVAYNTWEYFRDMGQQSRLKTIRQDYKLGIHQRLNFQKKQRVIFLDRDGVINEEVDELTDIDNLKIYPFSYSAIKKINQSGFHAIVITNQPMIAKGKLTEGQLDKIHCKLEMLLGRRGARIDAIYYCPHHPERGWDGEIEGLKIKCNCRKPNIGLIKRAVKNFNIDLDSSYFIGDSIHYDYQASKKAKIKFVGVRTGYGCKELSGDNKLNREEILLKKNLAEAVDYIIKH